MFSIPILAVFVLFLYLYHRCVFVLQCVRVSMSTIPPLCGLSTNPLNQRHDFPLLNSLRLRCVCALQYFLNFSVSELYNEILLTASEYAKLFTDRH